MHQIINKLLQWLEDSLLVITLTTMILLALSQIIMRNLFETGVEWSDPLLRVLVLWLGLLGAIAATRQSNHISIDIVSRILPGNGKLITTIINNVFSAVICAIISYYSSLFVIIEYQDGATAFIDVPAWLCEIIIPIGFGLMALRFLSNALAAMKNTPANSPE